MPNVLTDRKAVLVALSTAIEYEKTFLDAVGSSDDDARSHSLKLIGAWRRVQEKYTGSRLSVAELFDEDRMADTRMVGIVELRQMAALKEPKA